MLKRLHEELAVAYEITTDFIKYLRKNWLTALLFLLLSAGLFLFVVFILDINPRDKVDPIVKTVFLKI